MVDPEKAIHLADGTEADTEEVEDLEGEEVTIRQLNAEMLKNPAILASLKSRLGTMAACTTSYLSNLPKPVKRRIKALKKLQLDYIHLEAKFYQEVHSLECKYAQLYTPFYEKRHLVTSGTVEPTDEECDFPSDTENENDICAEIDKIKFEDEQNKPEEIKGVPDFWVTALKNVDMLAEMIQEYDEPILKHLLDIKVNVAESKPMGFILEFHFAPNEYFSNTVLTKHYEMKCTPEESDPFSFEGPEISKCKGCTIDWKRGKNVTVKTIKKKQKHKSRGAVRTVTKTVQNDSFFNFFNPPAVPDDEEQMDEETQAALAADFDIGHFIKERIVPRAVLYFTGEAISDDEYDEDEEDEEDDDDLDDEEDDDDTDHQPQATRGRKPRVQTIQQQQQQPPPQQQQQQQPPPECKQQ